MNSLKNRWFTTYGYHIRETPNQERLVETLILFVCLSLDTRRFNCNNWLTLKSFSTQDSFVNILFLRNSISVNIQIKKNMNSCTNERGSNRFFISLILFGDLDLAENFSAFLELQDRCHYLVQSVNKTVSNGAYLLGILNFPTRPSYILSIRMTDSTFVGRYRKKAMYFLLSPSAFHIRIFFIRHSPI